MAPILSVRNLSTGYGKKQVLFDVCLDVMPGEILLISGGNGSGKSTLLKAIYGLLPPWNADAEILVRPDPVGPALNTHPPNRNLTIGFAYLPQKNAVFDDLSVKDNLRLAGHTLRNHHEFAVRCDEVLASLPALRPLLRRKPDKMSGGERQMVALALLLIHRPRLLVLDEPTAGLDSRNSDAILGTLRAAHATMQLTLVVVEHRRRECAALGGRLCHMRLGHLEGGLIVQK